MSIIDNDFTYIGYPCFSKIANQLNNAAEIPEYTAFTLSVLKTDKADNPTLLVIAQESSLLPDSPIKNTDFICFKEGITEENVFDILMNESRIKKHKCCTRYYKRFDAKMSLCKLCPRSPYYQNAYIKEEYALLKFILSDRSNMQYFKELLKKYPAFKFMVVEDLALEYRTKNTYVYNSNAIFFECLKKHEDILYYAYNNYTLILKTSFSKAVKEGRRLPNSISEKENWSLIAIDKILKRIDNADDYSREEVENFLIRWHQEEKIRKENITVYESKLADNDFTGTSTEILDFSPKIKKVGQKKKSKKEEVADNKEETDIPIYDSCNFIKFPEEEINSNKNDILETPETDTEQLKNETCPEETPSTTDKQSLPVSEEANPVPETVEVVLTEDVEKITNVQPANAEEEVINEEYTSDYSDDDLIFDMYHNNIEDFYQEPAEDYSMEDFYTYDMYTSVEQPAIEAMDAGVNTGNTSDESGENAPISDNNMEVSNTDKSDIEDTTTKIPLSFNYENQDTNTALVISKPAMAVPYKKPLYKTFEEADDTLPYREVELLPQEMQLELEHSITDELLEQCILLTEDLVLLAEIETAILKERYFCVELVKDKKDNELFILYIHKLHRYYYTRLDGKHVREVLIPLFKMPSVKKYCYLPYYIYGYCTQKEIKIRSLHSIYAMQLCSKEDMKSPLGELCVKYMPYGQQALKKALEQASAEQWFYGIAYFRTIATKIPVDVKRLEQTNSVNEVLGISYLARRSFHTEERLFNITTDGKLIFQNELYKEWLKKVRFNGYSVKYTVSAEKEIQKESITSLLSFLSAKGYIKKYKIQLIALSNTTAYFYIEKEKFHYLDTIIQTYLFQYGRRLAEYHINISYEYHTKEK